MRKLKKIYSQHRVLMLSKVGTSLDNVALPLLKQVGLHVVKEGTHRDGGRCVLQRSDTRTQGLLIVLHLLDISQVAVFFHDNGGKDLERLLHLVSPSKIRG
jgi:hypothetical protein